MPQVSRSSKDVAEALKPFTFHGMDLDHRENSSQATGTCPYCLKDGKWYVAVGTGEWDCKSCGAKGNAITFLRLLHEQSMKETPQAAYEQLALDRLLLSPDTLVVWGVCQSTISGEWLVPGYDVAGKLCQLYRYVVIQGRYRLLATPTLNQHLHGVDLYDKGKHTVYICEGVWDACTLWEMLRSVKREDATSGSDLALTNNEKVSLLADVNILATPSANVYLPSWSQLCAGKKVVLLFDNDHPHTNGQRAGYDGMKRVAQALVGAEESPKEVKYLEWGAVAGHNPDLPSGYDVRDILTNSGVATIHSSRLPHLAELLAKVQPVPGEWLEKVARVSVACDNWRTLTNTWRKAMKWIDGLDKSLAVMLASVTSTKAIGDQLWVKIIGPPSSGKSTLCEALSVNKRYVLAKSTIRGFHSGFKATKGDGEDNSLLEQVRDKTLVTKDGDTLLQSPNLGQVLSEARDVYDRNSRTHYRNKASKDYENYDMTWILCGTNSLRALDKSELGERFLDCVIMDFIDTDVEDSILLNVVNKAKAGLSYESNGKPNSHDAPEMILAKQLTGGYVDYLRRNAQRLLNNVVMSDEVKRQCINLGRFVAYMRARPSTKQDETAERELAARLVGQITRLANCLAVVYNLNDINQYVMKRVAAVAMDTARGRVLEIVRWLYHYGHAGVEAKLLSWRVNDDEAKLRHMLKFLAKIEATEMFYKAGHRALRGTPKWRLTSVMYQLFAEVVGEDIHKDADVPVE